MGSVVPVLVVVVAVVVGILALEVDVVEDQAHQVDARILDALHRALGMLTADSMEMRWLLVALTAGIALIVAVWLLREKAAPEVVALGLVLGGALGNIRDRVTYGYVVDYADLHIGDWRPFLIFNLADAAITFGVLIILARSFLSREKQDNAGKPATET